MTVSRIGRQHRRALSYRTINAGGREAAWLAGQRLATLPRRALLWHCCIPTLRLLITIAFGARNAACNMRELPTPHLPHFCPLLHHYPASYLYLSSLAVLYASNALWRHCGMAQRSITHLQIVCCYTIPLQRRFVHASGMARHTRGLPPRIRLATFSCDAPGMFLDGAPTCSYLSSHVWHRARTVLAPFLLGLAAPLLTFNIIRHTAAGTRFCCPAAEEDRHLPPCLYCPPRASTHGRWRRQPPR